MADPTAGIYDFNSTTAGANEVPLGVTQQTPDGYFTDAPPQPKAPEPSFMHRAWRSVADMVGIDDSEGPTPAALKEAPIESPFFSGVGHGMRQAIDYPAQKIAAGVESLIGKDAAAAIPGSRSSEQIGEDIKQRQREYETDPRNQADNTPAMLGRGVGTGLALGGGITGLGRMAAYGIGRAGLAAAPYVGPALPYVSRGLEYLSGAARAAPEASVPAKLATAGTSLAAQGGTVGGTTAAITADPEKPFWPQVGEGAAGGAIAGPVVGSAIAGATLPVRAALGLVPRMVQQNVVNLADRFINQHHIGLDLTQLTQNPTYKLMADQGGKLPWSGVPEKIARGRLQWQGAVGREMGEPADTLGNGITHDVMDSAATRIGNGMDTIVNRTTVPWDRDTQNGLMAVAREVPRHGVVGDSLARIRAQFENIRDAYNVGNGQLTGRAYQTLTQRNGPLDLLIRSNDATEAAFGLRIKDVLDDAFARAAAPGDRAAWNALRYQYRVMKTIEPLVEQKGSTGDINPSGLLQRMRAQSAKWDPSTGGLAYQTGGTMNDLAYGGQIFFGPQADSGTAARQLTLAVMLGGGLKDAIKHPVATAATVGTLIANRGLQSLLRSQAVGGAAIENSIRPPGPWVQRATPYAIPGLLGP